jgi:hypothetical protein
LALCDALKNNRPLDAARILAGIYKVDFALRVRIDGLDASDWGDRLNAMMRAIAILVEAEVGLLPRNTRHVLASHALRGHDTLAGRLTSFAWKGRDALTGGAAFCKKLIS